MAVQFDIVAETGSTNADLLARLRAGEALKEGFWLLAEKQTGGKGRDGHSWVSPEGNLYASTVIELREGDPPAQTLSFVIGLAVYDHVCGALSQAIRQQVELKWPNDVLVNGVKIAGILLERSGNNVVAGIGINMAVAPDLPDRETTCLMDLNSNYEATPSNALGFLAERVSEQLALWRGKGVESLLRRWCKAAHPMGTPLATSLPGGETIRGTFDGLEPDGALLLRLADGSTRAIHAGDVMLEAR